MCWDCASACPCVKMFTVQVKGGSTVGKKNCGYGGRIIQNCENSSSVSRFLLLCLLLASKTCFSDMVLDLIILDGFFFSELIAFWISVKFIQHSHCKHWHSQLEEESCCPEIWGQKYWIWIRESSVWVWFSFVLFTTHIFGASPCTNGNKLCFTSFSFAFGHCWRLAVLISTLCGLKKICQSSPQNIFPSRKERICSLLCCPCAIPFRQRVQLQLVRCGFTCRYAKKPQTNNLKEWINKIFPLDFSSALGISKADCIYLK